MKHASIEPLLRYVPDINDIRHQTNQLANIDRNQPLRLVFVRDNSTWCIQPSLARVGGVTNFGPIIAR
jgi:hypothetical protein